MNTAIPKLAIMQVCFLGPFTCNLCHTGNRFPFLLRLLNLLKQDFCYIRMLMEIIINIFFDKVPYKLIDTYSRQRIWISVRILLRRHGKRTQFDLGLTLKSRFNHINGNGSYQSVTDILELHVLAEKFLDRPGQMFLESTLMCSTLSGMLPVDKGIIFFTVLRTVRESNLNILSFQMDDRIQSL